MNGVDIQRVAVWSARLRLAHAMIGASVIVLLATGGLIAYAPGVAEAASEVHQLAGIGLTLGLLLRVVLLFFGAASAHGRALLPAPGDLAKVGMMLRFYLSLGRTPLPRWYAHNPLWAPLYALLILVLVLQTLTGLLMNAYPLVGGFYLPSVHAFWSPAILAFTVLHLLAVVLHDLRGDTSDVSAIINGHRIFIVDRLERPSDRSVQSVPLDTIKRRS